MYQYLEGVGLEVVELAELNAGPVELPRLVVLRVPSMPCRMPANGVIN